METIANLHLPSENQSPHPIRSGKIRIRILGLLIGCALVGFAQTAIAQTLLKKGSSGQAVTELQNRLQELGCYSGGITGYFGDQTESGVIQCQQRAGIPADGVVGRETYDALGLSEAPRSSVNDRSSERTTSSLRYGDRLQYGDRGQAVRELQTQLRDQGYYNGAIDGIFGTSTETAVLQLQRDLNRPQTGVVDSAVYAALDRSTRPERVSLRPGDENDRVTQLQRQLDRIGYSVGITGYYGTQTESAVRQFQDANFLPVTGTADERTLSQIRQASGATGGEDGTSVSFTTRRNRYVVIVPIPSPNDLGRVTRIVPRAIPQSSRLGNYAEIETYATPEDAERAAANLRSRGLPDVRVIFR